MLARSAVRRLSGSSSVSREKVSGSFSSLTIAVLPITDCEAARFGCLARWKIESSAFGANFSSAHVAAALSGSCVSASTRSAATLRRRGAWACVGTSARDVT